MLAERGRWGAYLGKTGCVRKIWGQIEACSGASASGMLRLSHAAPALTLRPRRHRRAPLPYGRDGSCGQSAGGEPIEVERAQWMCAP